MKLKRSRLAPATTAKAETNGAHEHACDYAHCDKSFTTEQGLRMHIGRAHKKTILVPKQGTAKGKKAPKALAQNGTTHHCDKRGCDRTFPTAWGLKVHLAKGHKRKKYAARATRTATQSRIMKQAPIQISVNYCPHDGTDLLAVAAGLLLKGDSRPIAACPRCGLNLEGVAIGMATASNQA